MKTVSELTLKTGDDTISFFSYFLSKEKTKKHTLPTNRNRELILSLATGAIPCAVFGLLWTFSKGSVPAAKGQKADENY